MTQFGARGNGVADDTSAFQAAAAADRSLIVVPPGQYKVSGTIDILGGQSWLLLNAEINQTASAPIFRASSVNNWSILGSALLTGMGQNAGNADVGIYSYDCENFRIQGVQCEDFGEAGIWLRALNDTTMSTYRKRGQVDASGAHSCKQGILVGPRCEYNQISNWRSTNCTHSDNSYAGLVIKGGNTFLSLASAADCKNGAIIDLGDNGQHGSWVGGNVNHCTNMGLWCKGDKGFTFEGLHNYNSARHVYLDDCERFQFVGGHMSGGQISKSATVLSGEPNMFVGVALIGVTLNSSITSNAETRKRVMFLGCTDENGRSSFNEEQGAFATATISSGSFIRPGGNVIVDTQSAAASDDLDSITGGVTGATTVLRAANDARTVVVKHGTGNIRLAGSADFSLDNTLDRLTLQFDGTNWIELSRADNGA